VLPAFSNDGKWMIWTSQRGEDGESQLWAARFVLNLDEPLNVQEPARPAETRPPATKQTERIVIEDPETGRIFMYDVKTHAISEYHMSTHTVMEVTDPALLRHIVELYESQQEPN
jgi:hypothetical protein